MKMVLNLEMTKLTPTMKERGRQSCKCIISHTAFIVSLISSNAVLTCRHEVLSHIAPGPMLVVFYLKTTKLLG